jgi:nitroreductase
VGKFAECEAVFNNLSSVPAYLASRRSGKARDLAAPGPDQTTLDQILAIAARTPDHGKLFPWRFVLTEDRTALADLFERAFAAANPDARGAQIDAARSPAFMAPTLIILIHAPQPSAKIPEWEQQLSTGAVAMNLLHAVHAFGFSGNWITGWQCYDPIVRGEICETGEQIAGFFFIGTAAAAPEERPRPDMSQIVRRWPVTKQDG